MNREMKDSEIEWIGEIPENWKTIKLKRVTTFQQNKYTANDGDLNYVALENIESWNGKYVECSSIYDKNEALICEKGEVIFAKLRPYLAKAYISDKRQCCSGEFVVIRVNEPQNNKFFWYQFISHGFIFMINRSTYGAKMPRANVDFIKNVSVVLPPLDEQRRIASFLDRQCAELDAIMEKTRAILEECKKLKQAVITQAVTRGVRGARPMKDSGIEWIGEIPVEWETCELKKIANFNQDKYSSDDGDLDYIGLENIESWNGRFIKRESVYERDQALICEKGDIIFGKLRPYLAKVYLLPKKQCCSTEFIVVRMDGQFVVKYYWYLLISQLFVFWVDSSTYGSRMPRAKVNFIKNTSITIPSFDEQAEIVEYLDRRCAEIDALIAKEERRLAEIETCKKSLIYETVTGKREVE